MKNAFWVTLGLVAACGGAPPAATAPAPAAAAQEQFGPGLVAHDDPVDEVLRDAKRVLSGYHAIAESDVPGFVTTEWAVHSAYRWPGAETRMTAEVTADRVIVRIECRVQRDTCARTVPNSVELAELPQRIAVEIVGRRGAEKILRKMRDFKDGVCACTTIECVHDVETKMMEWAMKNMDLMKEMKPTRAEDEEADRIEEEMDACKEKLEAPSPPRSSYGSSSGGSAPRKLGSTGSPECDEYLKTFDELVAKCQKQMGPALDAMKQSRDAQAEAFAQWDMLDAASLEAVIEAAAPGCKSATESLRTSATSMGCKL